MHPPTFQPKPYREQLEKQQGILAGEANKSVAAQSGSMEDLNETDFFGPKNAIVKSFNSTKGKGLAGVITSMTLNYDQAEWATESAEKGRAPKTVEIALAFQPIHDLPLGLDSDGDLIAPSHPVGATMAANPYEDFQKRNATGCLLYTSPSPRD